MRGMVFDGVQVSISEFNGRRCILLCVDFSSNTVMKKVVSFFGERLNIYDKS
jgi:hypothetical protein